MEKDVRCHRRGHGSLLPSLPDRGRDPRRYHHSHQRWLISGGLVDLLGGPVYFFWGALPVMAQEETSASGETASEAPSNASRAAWSLRDLTEKGYGATDAALALLASDWDLNAAAALLESHAQTLDLLGLAFISLESANPAPPQEAPPLAR